MLTSPRSENHALFPPLGALGAQIASGTRAVYSPTLSFPAEGRGALGPGPTQPPSQSLDRGRLAFNLWALVPVGPSYG